MFHQMKKQEENVLQLQPFTASKQLFLYKKDKYFNTNILHLLFDSQNLRNQNLFLPPIPKTSASELRAHKFERRPRTDHRQVRSQERSNLVFDKTKCKFRSENLEKTTADKRESVKPQKLQHENSARLTAWNYSRNSPNINIKNVRSTEKESAKVAGKENIINNKNSSHCNSNKVSIDSISKNSGKVFKSKNLDIYQSKNEFRSNDDNNDIAITTTNNKNNDTKNNNNNNNNNNINNYNNKINKDNNNNSNGSIKGYKLNFYRLQLNSYKNINHNKNINNNN